MGAERGTGKLGERMLWGLKGKHKMGQALKWMVVDWGIETEPPFALGHRFMPLFL